MMLQAITSGLEAIPIHEVEPIAIRLLPIAIRLGAIARPLLFLHQVRVPQRL